MRRGAVFDSSFWVHVVYLDIVDFLLADYTLLCPRAVAKELGQENPTSQRLRAYVSATTIQLATPRAAKIVLYGDGERAAINLALERQSLLLIDDWRPYEAARAAGVEVVNTPAYLVQLYKHGRISLETHTGGFRPAHMPWNPQTGMAARCLHLGDRTPQKGKRPMRKTTTVTVRLTDEEYEVLQRLCALRQTSHKGYLTHHGYQPSQESATRGCGRRISGRPSLAQ